MNRREMTQAEMESKVGRVVPKDERVIFLENPCTDTLTEWHLILGIWTRMQ